MKKIIKNLFTSIVSLVLIAPLTIIYSIAVGVFSFASTIIQDIAVGVFSFASTIIQDIDELITYNKSIWK